MCAVQYPEMRDEVIGALASLSDRTHQNQRWGVVREGVSYYDDLTLNLHVLYDDAQVLPVPDQRVGTVILPREVASLRAVHDAIAPLLRELGESPDSMYTQDPRWDRVVLAAAAALRIMKRPDG